MGFVAHERLVIIHHDPPPVGWVRALTAAGVQVWMQVYSIELSTRAVEVGVHGLIAQGSEAGGHARGDVPLLPLIGQIRQRFPNMLLLGAGGIVDGAAAAAALRTGADGVWVGTRLVASAEAYAHREYKQRLVNSPGETVRTTAFGPEWPNQPYRLLATPTVRRWAGREDQIPPETSAGTIGNTRLFPHSDNAPYEMPAFCSLPPTRDTTGDWEAMAYPAGAGVGAVHSVAPAAEIIAEMMAQAGAELSR